MGGVDEDNSLTRQPHTRTFSALIATDTAFIVALEVNGSYDDYNFERVLVRSGTF